MKGTSFEIDKPQSGHFVFCGYQGEAGTLDTCLAG